MFLVPAVARRTGLGARCLGFYLLAYDGNLDFRLGILVKPYHGLVLAHNLDAGGSKVDFPSVDVEALLG